MPQKGAMDSILAGGGVAGLTPWGAGLQAATAIAQTPNTSAATAGDFFAGSNAFGTGIQTGGSGGIPTWALLAIVAVAAVIVMRRK